MRKPAVIERARSSVARVRERRVGAQPGLPTKSPARETRSKFQPQSVDAPGSGKIAASGRRHATRDPRVATRRSGFRPPGSYKPGPTSRPPTWGDNTGPTLFRPLSGSNRSATVPLGAEADTQIALGPSGRPQRGARPPERPAAHGATPVQRPTSTPDSADDAEPDAAPGPRDPRSSRRLFACCTCCD